MKLDYINRRAMFVFRDEAARNEVVATLVRLRNEINERSHTTGEHANLSLALLAVQMAAVVED